MRTGSSGDETSGCTVTVCRDCCCGSARQHPAVDHDGQLSRLAAGLAPVALLSFLKHPFTALGMRPGECRQAARTLERLCLHFAARLRGDFPGLARVSVGRPTIGERCALALA